MGIRRIATAESAALTCLRSGDRMPRERPNMRLCPPRLQSPHMGTVADERKRKAAAAGAGLVGPGEILGVGTGSTVNFLIEELPRIRAKIDAVLASSEETARRLRAAGFEVSRLSDTGPPSLYIDGADEIDRHGRMIKGGGGALTREKVLAYCAVRFVCIADESKRVDMLGSFPLPVEAIPFARSQVAVRLAAMDGAPKWRESFLTDNGNHIIDVANLSFVDPSALEREINSIPGVLGNGIFSLRKADVAVIAGDEVDIEGNP